METQFVKILDKKIPYELLESYVLVLWTYTKDHERGRAHDKMFEYMGIARYGKDSIDEDGESIADKYFDKIDDIVCEAYCCCGQSVDRDSVCFVCGTKLTMQDSISHMKKYLKLKKLLIVE